MSSRRVLALLAVLAFAPAAWAHAQGLGDTAAKERQKRTQAKKPPAKVFTNEDLDAGRPPGSKKSSEESSSSPTPAREEAQPSAPAEPSRLEQERPYIDAIQNAEAGVKGAEARIKELQGRLNPMSTTYIYGAGGSNDANEELRVREELRQAEAELQSARQAVVQANQNLSDFRQGRSPTMQQER